MPKDELRDVPGYEGCYRITSDGEIFSMEREIRNKNGYRTFPGGKLHQSDHKQGYKCVTLSKRCKSKGFLTHRLVVEAFIGKIPSDKEINHINGNKKDNRIENLEIVTRVQNIRHAMETGLINNIGENNPFNKLTEKQVREIRSLYSSGQMKSYKRLGAKFFCTWSNIRSIIKGRSWSNV